MTDWRDLILRDFTPELSRVTLVADPDGLLTEEKVQAGIRERGFELIPFDDPVAFRLAYETRYRKIWDTGQTTELVVALRSEAESLRHLPYDLLQRGRQLDYRLTQIFPNLSYPVVQMLRPDQLDQLYRAQELHGGNVLGDRGTLDFILDHVFDFLPKQTWQAKDLLRALLRHHYSQTDLPESFANRISSILKQTGIFRDWPLAQIVSSRSEFVDFLQEQWPRFLELRSSQKVAEDAPGLPVMPFDNEDVRVYLDNYFAEGVLQPVTLDPSITNPNDWTRIGVREDPARSLKLRFERLATRLEESVPSENALSGLWQSYAGKWADFQKLLHDAYVAGVSVDDARVNSLRALVDSHFSAWLTNRYDTLQNQTPSPPVMVHHVARHLARIREKEGRRVAAVVIDGVTIQQWRIVQSALVANGYAWEERAVFAWIPTLTPISRQSIFAGKPPNLFPSSIGTTLKESDHWRAFWLDHGVTEAQSAFVKIAGSKQHDSVDELLPNLSHVSALGVVLTAVDEMVHGTVLGLPQLISSVEVWNKTAVLQKLLGRLVDADFHVAIVSDHGNIPSRGIGSPKEGMLAETRGERVRIYPDETIRGKFAAEFPMAASWTPHGLPPNICPLFAPAGAAFINQGEERICHGGMSLDEVLVPFAEVRKGGANGNRI